MEEEEDVCDKIRHSEGRCCREKRASAIVFVLRAWKLCASAEESARFDRARNEAKTSCEGLFDGHRFDRMAGRTDADCMGERNARPPAIVVRKAMRFKNMADVYHVQDLLGPAGLVT